MANQIIIKNGNGTPPNNALTVAELGFDTKNKRLYVGDSLETNFLINPLSINLEGTNSEAANSSKPQSPLRYEDKYFYPLTTADQIITGNGTRLNAALNGIVYAEEQDGNIKTLFADSTKTEALFPRTNVEAISDNDGTGLDVLLNNLDASIGTKQEKHKPISVSLSSSNWSNMKQTVSANGVTANNTIIPSPAPASHVAYGEAGVYCSAQGENTLTFTCSEIPSANLTVNVLIMN